MERLDFSLPAFTRLAWVSDRARNVWQPRFARVEDAIANIAWLSVVEGVRRCAIVDICPNEHIISGMRWLKHGLSYLPIEQHCVPWLAFRGFASEPKESPYIMRLAIARTADLPAFVEALEREDQQVIVEAMGWPACCQRMPLLERGEIEFQDSTWTTVRMALNGGNSNIVDISGPPQTNQLLRYVGISILPHVACKPECAASVTLADQLIEVGRSSGYDEEMDWLLEILSWPIEWSALHGIAEIKMPLFRISSSTDATAVKYVARRTGSTYPEEGARALRFPFTVPQKLKYTDSAAYRRGLSHPLPVLSS